VVITQLTGDVTVIGEVELPLPPCPLSDFNTDFLQPAPVMANATRTTATETTLEESFFIKVFSCPTGLSALRGKDLTQKRNYACCLATCRQKDIASFRHDAPLN
jgi:hypothetical protein